METSPLDSSRSPSQQHHPQIHHRPDGTPHVVVSISALERLDVMLMNREQDSAGNLRPSSLSLSSVLRVLEHRKCLLVEDPLPAVRCRVQPRRADGIHVPSEEECGATTRSTA
jgi:hypothetical protein